jgi:hypothetical protein
MSSQFRSPEAIAAYERAVEIDPLFERAVQNLAASAIEAQDHATVDRVLQRITRAGASPALIGSIRAKQFYSRGDYSGAVEAMLEVGLDARSRAPQMLWGNWLETLTGLGYFEALHTVTGCPEWYAPMLGGKALPPRMFEGRAVSPDEFWTSQFFSGPASRAMVNLGQSKELVRLYRAGFRDSDEFISQTRQRGMLAALAPTLAVALNSAGFAEEASYILAAAANEVEPPLKRSANREAAGELVVVRAAQGERVQALLLLEAVRRQGWLPDGRNHALDLAQEPALKDLRGNPRFEEIRRRILAHIARERSETRPINL